MKAIQLNDIGCLKTLAEKTRAALVILWGGIRRMALTAKKYNLRYRVKGVSNWSCSG